VGNFHRHNVLIKTCGDARDPVLIRLQFSCYPANLNILLVCAGSFADGYVNMGLLPKTL
jgi:hypothetical protein